ncbi:MAG: transporter [Micavibrio sp.]
MACLITQPAYADHPSLGFGAAGAGPITTVQAATIPEGTLALGLTSEYIHSDRFSDSELVTLAGNHVHAHSADWILTTAFGASYGLTNDLTLSLRVPTIHRENIRAASHAHGGGGAVNSVDDQGDSSGHGDMAALGKYRFWNQGGTQAALLFGVKAPTGRTDIRHDGEKPGAEHQPGSGSWDGLFGFAAGTKAGPVSLDANVLFALVTKGTQDTDLGDRLQYNLAASYRIGGEVEAHGDMVHRHRAWDLVLELNGEWTNQQMIAGERDDDSGGNVIFLSPGLRYAPDDRWAGQLSVGVPVVSNLGQGHADTDYKVIFGFARVF